jgi:hypothetical protein
MTSQSKINMQVPAVTNDDVVRIVKRDFAAQEVPSVMAILDEYGGLEWQREVDRVRLA